MIFLQQPSYGPAGPDGQGMNRLSLNAGFDSRHQCGLQPTDFTTLWESMTGRQYWGGYGRCHKLAPGHCGDCPVHRSTIVLKDGIHWPGGAPLLQARIRPLAPTPGAMFVNWNAALSTLELRPWPGGPVLEATWQQVRSTRGFGISWFWRDEGGEAFWMVRAPDTTAARVRTETTSRGVRHTLRAREREAPAAVVECAGGCGHDDLDLLRLAADLADAGEAADSAWDPPLPTGGLRGVTVAHDRTSNVSELRRGGRTASLRWPTPLGPRAWAAVCAHAVRLGSAT
ncbi:hypothetical protein [Kitasatospora sp. NPDC088783]|uniref:hypothetical protein n=1 Tax=Kitasatospora sp. NPDC088783 TaxID=3364077 RepID=UPI003822BF30